MTMTTEEVIAKYRVALTKIYENGVPEHDRARVFDTLLRDFRSDIVVARDGWTLDECRDWVIKNCAHLRAERKVIDAIKLLRGQHQWLTGGVSLGLLDAKNSVYRAWRL